MKHVNLRLPDDLHEIIVSAAAADDRSLNSWLVAVARRATSHSETPDSRDGHPATHDLLRRSPDSPPA